MYCQGVSWQFTFPANKFGVCWYDFYLTYHFTVLALKLLIHESVTSIRSFFQFIMHGLYLLFYNFLKIDQQFHWSLPLNKGARTLPRQCSAINIPVKYGAFSSASYLKDSSVCFHIDVPLFHGLPSYLFNLLSNAEILGFAQLRWKLWLISELSS